MGLIIDSVIDHSINISKYSPLAGSSYIKLPQELNHPKKGLINIQNIDDNEWFKWCLVRYLHPAYHHPLTNRKVGILFGGKLDLEDIKFPVKFKDIHKIEKKKILSALVFLVMEISKISNICFKKLF